MAVYIKLILVDIDIVTLQVLSKLHMQVLEFLNLPSIDSSVKGQIDNVVVEGMSINFQKYCRSGK